jgi:hypothetical protein
MRIDESGQDQEILEYARLVGTIEGCWRTRWRSGGNLAIGDPQIMTLEHVLDAAKRRNPGSSNAELGLHDRRSHLAQDGEPLKAQPTRRRSADTQIRNMAMLMTAMTITPAKMSATS